MSSQSRRRFLAHAAFAGAAGLGGFLASGKSLAAEGPPETSSVRFTKIPATCLAPQYAAEELLHAEGFTDVRYVNVVIGTDFVDALARGSVDFSMGFVPGSVAAIDAGDPITLLSGVHAGCIEFFGNESVRNITDLKGKRVGCSVPAAAKRTLPA